MARSSGNSVTPFAVAPAPSAPAAVFLASRAERVQWIRQGVPAVALIDLVEEMNIPKERLYHTLRFSRATIDRKIARKTNLTPEQSERLIGLEKLIGQVSVMVSQSGNPDGFNASRWVGEWLTRPLPALGGEMPGDLMDTIEGQEIVSRLLTQSQSGAYA